MTSVRVVLLVFALGATLLPATAAADATGVIEGKLVNATAGSGVPTGASAVLYSVRDQQLLGQLSQTIDAEGRFRFEGLDTDPTLVYLVVAQYQEVLYPHPQLLRLGEQPHQTVAAIVYEANADASAISLDRSSMLIAEVAPDHVVVMEMGSVLNSADRTYLGDAQGALRLSLPVGVTDVTPEAGLSGDDLQVTAGGVISKRPISPGRHQFAIRYSLPVTGSVLDLSRRLEQPVSTFSLYLPRGVLQASSPQLVEQGGAATEIGGVAYQVYNGQNLAAGSTLSIRVSGLPARTWQPTEEELAGLTLGGGLALGAATWLLVRRRTVRRRLAAAEDEELSAGGLPSSPFDKVRTSGEVRLGTSGELRLGTSGEVRLGTSGEVRLGTSGELRLGTSGEVLLGTSGEGAAPHTTEQESPLMQRTHGPSGSPDRLNSVIRGSPSKYENGSEPANSPDSAVGGRGSAVGGQGSGVGGQRSAIGGQRSAVDLETERRCLVLELAELDECFAAGQVAESDYHTERGERKRRLLAVAKQMVEVEP